MAKIKSAAKKAKPVKKRSKSTQKSNKNKKNQTADQDNRPNDEQYEVTLEKAFELAQGHHAAQNYVLADRTYRDILRAVPDHFDATHLLGVLLFQTGNPEEALEYMHLALNQEPENKAALNNLGAIYTDSKRYDEALDAYNKALKIDPNFIDTLNNKALTLTMLDQNSEAENIANKALSINPKNLDALICLGIAYSQQSKFEEAVEAWEKASEIYPQVDRIWTNWGNTLRDMGKMVESEAKCRKALEINPGNHETLNNLGNALRDRGHPEEAEDCYKKATNICPDFYQAHNNLAIALCDQNRFEEAVIAARYAVCFNKKSSSAYSTLSKALREMGEFPLARAAAQKAVYLAPDRAEPYLDLADVNFMADFLDDGEAALQEALRREADSPRAYKKLSDIKDKMTDMEGALKAIDTAIEMSPNMPLLWLSKAQILQKSYDIEGAFKAVDKCLSLAPNALFALISKAEMLITIGDNKKAEKLVRNVLKVNKRLPAAYSTLTSLKKFKSVNDPDFKDLKKLAKNEMHWGLPGATIINYSLSDAYEQMGKFNQSFKHLKLANDYKRQTIPYDTSSLPKTYEPLKKSYNKDLLSHLEGKGCSSKTPVFILGMPRSGTTLTEQIISSHPKVFGAGELTIIHKIRNMHRGVLDETSAKLMGQNYIEQMKKFDKSGKAIHITDKMPGNYMNIGLISCILPNAKIIHCRRSPIDTCLSNYKQNFSHGQYWSYNLEEMAAEYNRYLDIMAYWRSVLPGRFLEIDYEDTVGNFEEQAKKLIDYVGLPWDKACLSPHKQKRMVLTASKAQVTKPVYKSSVEKWKRYEKHLGPLISNLDLDLYEASKVTN